VNNLTFQCGDIFLCDSNSTGAKLVKFLMTAPTLWQYLWRKLRGTQEVVRYYHGGMFLDDYTMIEQQGKVQYGKAPHSILSRKMVVYRKKNLSVMEMDQLSKVARLDLGEGYDIPLIMGKTLTWLTGLRIFENFLGWLSKDQEICVTRVAYWYESISINFGVKEHEEITTKIIDEYCGKNINEWETVYING
jgi:hypothetical protein